MARQPAPDVKITEALQPAASVHDTYVRPPTMEPSPLHAVAKSLFSLSEDLTSSFEKMDAANAVNAKEQGEAAFWMGKGVPDHSTETTTGPTAPAIAEGYRQGIIPTFGKSGRLFQEGYQGAAGYAAGSELRGRVLENYNNLDTNEKMNMTPQQFDAWVLGQIRADPATAGADKSGGYAKGITSQFMGIHKALTDQWNSDRLKDQDVKATNAWGAAVTTTLEQDAIEGKARAGGPDYDQMTANVQAIRDAGFKSGLTQDKIDKEVAKAVISRASLERAPDMLSILDKLKTPDGKPLSAQPDIRDAKFTAMTSIASLREQDRQRAQAESDRQDKLAHDGSLRKITEGLVKDNNYTPSSEDVANVYRRDPQAAATFMKLRQTIADGKGFEDPHQVASLMSDIYAGKGWDAYYKAMASGTIQTAKTLKEARDAVISMETYTQQDVKLFEGQSWKRMENFILDAGAPKVVGGPAFREPAQTAASMAALNDARVIGLKWLQAHPNATKIEQEQFIADLSGKFLPAFGPAPEGGAPIYSRPEALTKAREGAPENPVPNQPGAPVGAPAASPAAPAAGPDPGKQNPLLKPGSSTTAVPAAPKQWIQDLAASPEAPPKYETMKMGDEYRKDIEETARKTGQSPQQVIDKVWGKLKANIDAATKANPPAQAPQAPVTTPEAAPGAGKRSDALEIPGLGRVDLASIGQDQIRAIAGQIMQRVQLQDGKFSIPGVGEVAFTPEGKAAAQEAFSGITPDGTPVVKASARANENIAIAATQTGVDLGAKLRDGMPQDMAGITAETGGPAVGSGLQQVSARRVARIDAKPVGSVIDRVAKSLGFPPEAAKAVADIESSGNPGAVTGSYKGLYQLSNAEFAKYGPKDGRDIMDPEANAYAGIRSMMAKSAQFQKEFGRPASPTEIYLMHQQGEGGLRAHASHPERKAWESMLSTGEGRQKGERWAKLAVWGNVPSDMKAMFGSVDNMTSAQFIAVWVNKLQGVPYQQALQLIQGGTKLASKPSERDV